MVARIVWTGFVSRPSFVGEEINRDGQDRQDKKQAVESRFEISNLKFQIQYRKFKTCLYPDNLCPSLFEFAPR
jgi:hypothetical protein